MQHKDEYLKMLAEIESVIDEQNHSISNLANCVAIIASYFKHHWIGFYIVDQKQDKLYLGPFQGPLACTYIPYGKGVCGSAWKEKRIIIVDDVHQFSGHIACSSLSNSEIVIPVIKNNQVLAVLDIDSEDFAKFTDMDRDYYQKICAFIAEKCF